MVKRAPPPESSDLYNAVAEQSLEKVEAFLSERGSLEGPDGISWKNVKESQWNCIHKAVALDNLEIVKLLLNNDTENAFQARDKRGNTALLVGVSRGVSDEVLGVLLERGSSVDERRSEEPFYTALQLSIAKDQANVSKFLVAQFADLNLTNGRGRTALHEAALRGKPEMVRLILGGRATLLEEDPDRKGVSFGNLTPRTPRQEDGEKGDEAAAAEGEGQGEGEGEGEGEGGEELPPPSPLPDPDPADVSLRDEKGLSALEIAIKGGHEEIATVLVEAEAKQAAEKAIATPKDGEGEEGEGEEVEKPKAFFESFDHGQLNPLHRAINGGLLELTKALVTQQPQLVPLRDNKGRFVSHLAVDPTVAAADEDNELLTTVCDAVNAAKKGGAEISLDSRDLEGNTPLHKLLSEEEPNQKKIELLTSKGASVVEGDSNGLSALWHSAKRELEDICIHFLDVGQKAKQNVLESVNYPQGDTAGHILACAGLTKPLKKLVDIKANLEGRNVRGETLLHIAASQGSGEVCEVLLGKKAAGPAVPLAGVGDVQGRTPLHAAAVQGHENYVTRILATNAAISNEVDKWGVTPLMAACRAGQLATATLILGCNKHSSLDAKDKAGWTALHHAVEGNHLEVLQKLVASNANIQRKDSSGMTPLHIAATEGYNECAQELIAAGAKVNSRDGGGATPLHAACRDNIEECVETIALLVENGASLDIKDNAGRNAFHVACAQGSSEHAKKLLELRRKREEEARAKEAEEEAEKAAQEAPKEGEEGEVQVQEEEGEAPKEDDFLDNGVDTRSPQYYGLLPDSEGQTALHIAAHNDRDGCVHMLLDPSLDTGASVDQVDPKGRTPLHTAAGVGATSCVTALIEDGADRDTRDEDGKTSLHLASLNGHTDTGEALVCSGSHSMTGRVRMQKLSQAEEDQPQQTPPPEEEGEAGTDQESPPPPETTYAEFDVNVRDKDEVTPLHDAFSNGHLATAQFLIGREADKAAVTKTSQTILHSASASGSSACVAFVQDTLGFQDTQDDNKSLALHVAAKKGHLNVALQLIVNGSRVDLANGEGETAEAILSKLQTQHENEQKMLRELQEKAEAEAAAKKAEEASAAGEEEAKEEEGPTGDGAAAQSAKEEAQEEGDINDETKADGKQEPPEDIHIAVQKASQLASAIATVTKITSDDGDKEGALGQCLELLDNSPRLVHALVKARRVPPLTDLFSETSNEDLKTLLLRVLTLVVTPLTDGGDEDADRVKVATGDILERQPHVLETLLASLSTKTPELILHAVTFLDKLLSAEDDASANVVSKFEELGGEKAFVSAVSNDCLLPALSVAASLAQNRSVAQGLVANGFDSVVVEALENADNSICLAASNAINRVCAWAENREAFASDHADAVLAVMNKFDAIGMDEADESSSVRCGFCGTVGVIGLNETVRTNVLDDSGLLERLLDLVEMQQGEELKAAAYALACLSSSDDRIKTALYEAGAIEKLLSALTKGDEAIQLQISRVIGNISNNDAIRRKLRKWTWKAVSDNRLASWTESSPFYIASAPDSDSPFFNPSKSTVDTHAWTSIAIDDLPDSTDALGETFPGAGADTHRSMASTVRFDSRPGTAGGQGEAALDWTTITPQCVAHRNQPPRNPTSALSRRPVGTASRKVRTAGDPYPSGAIFGAKVDAFYGSTPSKQALQNRPQTSLHAPQPTAPLYRKKRPHTTNAVPTLTTVPPLLQPLLDLMSCQDIGVQESARRAVSNLMYY